MFRMRLEVEKIALLLNNKLVLVAHSKQLSLLVPVIPGPEPHPPNGSLLLRASVQNVPFLSPRLKFSLVSPLLVARPFATMLLIVMTTMLVLKISAIPTETQPLQSIVDMSQMPADVTLNPNVELGTATLLLVAYTLLSLLVTTTTFVPMTPAMINLVARLLQVSKPKSAKTRMIAMLHSVINILVVSKTNSTVTHLIIVLWPVAILIGTTNPPTKMEKPLVAIVPTQLVHVIGSQFVLVSQL